MIGGYPGFLGGRGVWGDLSESLLVYPIPEILNASSDWEHLQMTTRLKIDLTQGFLEVEGSETFVKAIYKDFKIHFLGEEAGDTLEWSGSRRRRKTTKTASKSKSSVPAAEAKPEPKAEPKPKSKPVETIQPEPEEELPADLEAWLLADETEFVEELPKKPQYNLLEDLDLSAAKNRVSLVEFMDQKFPITNEERNLVFLYYLQYMLKTKIRTADHVYTCYKAAKIRVPLDLESSLQITATQRRWIKITKTGRLSVSPAGKLYVEKQLPKKLKS